MSGQSALILGATGATGRHLLRELLLSPNFTRVGEFGRRVTPLDKLEAQNLDKSVLAKLKQETVDFEKVDEESQKWKDGNWDVVFIAMGTSRKKAGSAAAFEKIDREYVVNAAKAARTTSHTQRLVYLSSNAANPSSFLLYARSKGQTEQELASLGYPDTIIVRPGMLTGAERPGEFRPLEAIFYPILNIVAKVHSEIEAHVTEVAKAMTLAGQFGSTQLPSCASATKNTFEGHDFTVIPNSGIVALSKETP